MDSATPFYSLQYTVTHALSFGLLVAQLEYLSENVHSQRIKIGAEFMFLLYQMTLMMQSDANSDIKI